MTKEQEEAIEYLRKLHPKIYWIKPNGPLLEEDKVLKKAIETVLNMLKEKDADIAEYKNIIEAGIINAAKDELVEEKNKEIEKKDKMIDLMSELIARKPGSRIEICHNMQCDKKVAKECKICTKQYFERKVEDECKR